MLTDFFETGSGGFVWKNIPPHEIISRIQFHVYAAFDMQVGTEWQGSQFINHYNRIYYVKSGEAELIFKDKAIRMRPGYCYLIPAYQLVSHSCSKDLHFLWTHFQAKIDASVDYFTLYAQALEINGNEHPEFTSSFESLVKIIDEQSISSYLERNRLLLTLLNPFMKEIDKDSKHGANGTHQKLNTNRHKALLPSLSKMNQDVTKTITLKQLAEIAKMSPEHFSRKFKSVFNVSPKRYIMLKRIGLAKQRLLSSHDTIEKIAIDCGFCDIFHFSRTFKQELGMPPSDFKREYRMNALAKE
jgi:AraC-like DNA-binding protein